MTDRYALFGNPLGHSKSALIHGTFARETGHDMRYDLIEAPSDGFRQSVATFRGQGGLGMNVTMPFKLDAYALADVRSERALAAGASNAMQFDGDRLLAENFDGVGLVRDIERNLGYPLAGKRVLLMGAGGAARGSLLPILQARPAHLAIANRTVSMALVIAKPFHAAAALVAGGYDDLGVAAFDVVINATSASMRGEMPAVPMTAFAADCLAYDLVYGRHLTPFLRFARERGARCLADGGGMLVEQAAEAFSWWRGIRPDTGPVISAITVPLT